MNGAGDTCTDSSIPGVVTVRLGQTDGSACISPPTVTTPCFVTVSIQYTYRTIAPWPIVPNIPNCDRSTTKRTFY